MRISEIIREATSPAEGLDANQRRAGQAGPDFVPKKIRVLGKKSTQHPFKGKLVGDA